MEEIMFLDGKPYWVYSKGTHLNGKWNLFKGTIRIGSYDERLNYVSVGLSGIFGSSSYWYIHVLSDRIDMCSAVRTNFREVTFFIDGKLFYTNTKDLTLYDLI